MFNAGIIYLCINDRYGCSDHFSWYKVGVDSIFTFESSFQDHSPYIHTTEDTIDHISMEHVAEFSKVIIAFAVELGLWLGP